MLATPSATIGNFLLQPQRLTVFFEEPDIPHSVIERRLSPSIGLRLASASRSSFFTNGDGSLESCFRALPTLRAARSQRRSPRIVSVL